MNVKDYLFLLRHHGQKQEKCFKVSPVLRPGHTSVSMQWLIQFTPQKSSQSIISITEQADQPLDPSSSTRLLVFLFVCSVIEGLFKDFLQILYINLFTFTFFIERFKYAEAGQIAFRCRKCSDRNIFLLCCFQNDPRY